MIDDPDSNKFDIANHSNQNSVDDCATNLKSVNMDDNQIPLEGVYFLSYPSFYDELIYVPNIYSDEHEALKKSKYWLTESLKRQNNKNSSTDDDVIIKHVHSEST